MIKIIAVDDDPAYLDFLATIVFPITDIQFKLMARISHMEDKHNIEFLLEKIRNLNPDLVLMDMSFVLVNRPEDFGIQLVRTIRSVFPEQKIIMLVGDQGSDDKARANKIIRSFEAGALAYLEKREIAHYREAIEEVIHGDMYVSKSLSKLVLRDFSKNASAKIVEYKLTQRHLELLHLLCEGLDITQIAEQMKKEDGKSLDINTVNFHLKTIRKNMFKDQEKTTLHGIVAKVLKEKIIS